MTREEVLAKIRKTKDKGYTNLSLSGSGLRELPAGIGELTKLTILHLNDNDLSELSSEIGKLTNLKYLYLNDNSLGELTPEIGALVNLRALALNNNSLKELPREIGKLAHLEGLTLDNNDLEELPREIVQLKGLTTLSLQGNPLISPPMEIAKHGIEAIRAYYESKATDGPTFVPSRACAPEGYDVGLVDELVGLTRNRGSGYPEAEADTRSRINEIVNELTRSRPPRSGDTILECVLVRIVGKGSYGTVWEAKRASGELCAIKIFDFDQLGIGTKLYHFRRGVRAMTRLSEVGKRPVEIAKLHEAHGTGLAFTMDFFEGGDLCNIAARGWSIEKKYEVMGKICRAVRFAHENRIIHRDIKPANVVMTQDSEPVLTDFDIADLLFASTLSIQASGAGTVMYAAPEQLDESTQLEDNWSADVYSLGRLLHFLLIEKDPSPYFDDPNPLTELEGKRAPGLARIVRKCTRRSPEDRYQTVDELINALESVDLNEEPAPESPDTLDGEYDVFLCHNSKDKAEVEKIYHVLMKRGVRPWFDTYALEPGRVWQRQLEATIETIGSVAVIVGPDGLGPWQNVEQEAFIREFTDRGCPVIPVILKGCKEEPELPVFLRAFHWVDFRKEVPDPMAQLVRGIGIFYVRLTDGDESGESSLELPAGTALFYEKRVKILMWGLVVFGVVMGLIFMPFRELINTASQSFFGDEQLATVEGLVPVLEEAELNSDGKRVLSNETWERIAALSLSFGSDSQAGRMARGELLLLLFSYGIDASPHVSFEGAYLPGAQLRGIVLRGVNLSGASLDGAFLREADLRDSNLRGADLRSADLEAADISGADLREVDFRGASLGDVTTYRNTSRFAFANVFGLRRVQQGFKEWAREHGAVEAETDEEWEALKGAAVER